MDKVNLYVVTSAKSPAPQRMAGYFLIEHLKGGVPETKEGRLYRDRITEADMTLQLLINSLYLLKNASVEYDTLSIYTKCPIIDSAFNQKWIDTWKSNDFKTQKGKDVSNKEHWQQLCEMLDGLSHRYIFSIKNTSYFNIMTKWSNDYLRYHERLGIFE